MLPRFSHPEAMSFALDTEETVKAGVARPLQGSTGGKLGGRMGEPVPAMLVRQDQARSRRRCSSPSPSRITQDVLRAPRGIERIEALVWLGPKRPSW
jgi:hypothetical protein